jgi:hypothetical protein
VVPASTSTRRAALPDEFFFHSGIDREYGDNISSPGGGRSAADQGEDAHFSRLRQRADAGAQPRGHQHRPAHGAKYRDELAIPSPRDDRKQIF